ncbi:MAG: sigma 54-interacting transcriptional regulator [bacterium]|nr:sigma 54-interacting transcriptional regulator [bacterium]
MKDADRIDFLKTTELFAGVSNDLLERICGSMELADVRAGTTLFRAGDAGDAVYLVVTGTLSIEKDDVQLVTRGPGECIGEFALIDDAPRSTDVVAETDVRLLRWGRTDFQASFTQTPSVAQGLFRILLGKLREDVENHVAIAQQLQRENRTLRLQIEPTPEAVSRSIAMQEVLDLAWRIADSASTVLLRGETGTGKEVIARGIHQRSPYREGPFVPVHCAALPEGLMESELFGHEKGSFTGATARRQGRFELADGGTLFLDEVGEIGPDIQVKLLRVLQERNFQRVGGEQTVNVNVRVIAATKRDLEAEVQTGGFREDLYYRLNVIPIVLLPLRERREDIAVLVEHFLKYYSQKLGRHQINVSPEAMGVLEAYAWPGNIRELQNLMERMVVVVEGPDILPRHLPPEVRGQISLPDQNPEQSQQSEEGLTLQEHERRYIQMVLEQTNWMIAGPRGAAQLLGVPPSTLRSRMKKLKINRP